MSNIFKVGTHRGNKRVWFQGGHLIDSSFIVGAPYFVNFNDDVSIILALASEGTKGTRKVSKKPSAGGSIPVIDLNSKPISRFFGDATSCEVIFGTGWIEIKRCE